MSWLFLSPLILIAADSPITQPSFHARIPKVGGWAMTADNVTLILSHPSEAKLAFFDTVANKPSKALELEFKPERLALRGDEIFASQANSGQVFRVKLDTGEVLGKVTIGGEVVNSLACHDSSGPVYAATKSGTVYSLDFAKKSSTKTTARGNHVAVDPASPNTIYTGADGQLKDVIEISRGVGGFSARAVTQIVPNVLMKFDESGKNTKRVSATSMASIGLEAVLRISHDGGFVALPARGGWMSADDRLHGGILVFDANDLSAHLGEIAIGSPIDVAFHPVLKIGVALGDNVTFKVFRVSSLAERATITAPRMDHTYWFNMLTFAGRGTRIAYLQGENLCFFELPLDENERALCEKKYGKLPDPIPPVVVAKAEPKKVEPQKMPTPKAAAAPPPPPKSAGQTVASKEKRSVKKTKSTGSLRSVATAQPSPADVSASDVHEGKAGRGRTTSANTYTLKAQETSKIGRTAVVFQAAISGPSSSSGQVMASLDGHQWTQIHSWTTEGCKAAVEHGNWHVALLDSGPLSERETGQLMLRFDFKRGVNHLAIQQVHWVQR